MFEPKLRVPLVSVNVPSKFRFPYKLTPLVRLIVRLLSVKAGIFMTAPEPPIIILVELPPVTVPVIAVTTPLNVNVFVPMAKLPSISAIPLLIVKSPFKENPNGLLIVNESTVLFTNVPASMDWAIVPAYTIEDEVAVPSIFAPFEKIKLPVNVSCFPFNVMYLVPCVQVIFFKLLF